MRSLRNALLLSTALVALSCEQAAPCQSDIAEATVSSEVRVWVTATASAADAIFSRNGEFLRRGSPATFGTCTVFAFTALSDADPGQLRLRLPTREFELRPNTTNSPMPGLTEYFTDALNPLAAGDVVGFDTTGGDIAPFAIALRIPPIIEVSFSPPFTAGAWTTSTAPAVTWTPTTGEVFVSIRDFPLMYDQFRAMECFFDARLGAATIPAAAIAAFGAGNAELSAGSSCRATVQAGGQTVRGIAEHANDSSWNVRIVIGP